MKTLCVAAPLFSLLLSRAAFAQAALPAGYYDIDGTVISISNTVCPLAAKQPVRGHLYYPGVGHDTTQLVLSSTVIGKSVTVALMFAFPAVPAGGLNGWSGSNYASPNYIQYLNGKGVSGGTAADLSFSVNYIDLAPLATVQGTLTINVDSIAPCVETLQVIFTRVAPFAEVKG